jgi:hypothetical protein
MYGIGAGFYFTRSFCLNLIDDSKVALQVAVQLAGHGTKEKSYILNGTQAFRFLFVLSP